MRLFVLSLLFVLIALQARLWLSDGGLRERQALAEQVREQSERNAELARRNEALMGEVRDLRDGVDAAEERARSDLGMVRPDETYFQVVERADGR